MDGFIDFDKAVEAEANLRLKHIENLSSASALIILSAATWLAWPALTAAMNGGSLLSGIGYSIILLAWGVLVQDLAVMDEKSRSKIGAASTIAYLPILVLAGSTLNENISHQIGAGLLVIVSYYLFKTSRNILRGDMDVMRFRAVMGFLGLVLASSLVKSETMYFQSIFIIIGLYLTSKDWFGHDEQRENRKKFDTRLNQIEQRMLELKSIGAAVDQAGSLVVTAREEGHRDPEWGMRLLDDAEEDIERSLSLAGDVEAIRADTLATIETAEEIAPIIKRPRKAFEMAEREVELGSLREGESLYRQAKKRATEVVEWWQKAEDAIREGAALIAKSPHAQNNLSELLTESKKKLNAEQPKKAFEYAKVIPDQISASGEASEIAEASLKEANRQLKSADGIVKSSLQERLDRAQKALDSGDHAQAKGLAEGVSREIVAEREAMEDVRRALRQKVHLITQWSGRDDASDWDTRLVEIEEQADQKQWTHAATLLDRMTRDLDSEGKASDEVSELLDFIKTEWNSLRNQCDTASIKPTDEERRSTEESIGLAIEAHKAGRADEALEALGLADGFMERLRRRV
ncbi:MAG: hypothetical protein CXT71_00185 [Methanobacteriota archaeon]|nr:MAG: hypothetical protein CXT71_00185 [Euryarchaeota archaeon]HIL65764.1 hypothetical protein [Candidatus Poseidoniales archaeon]